MAINAGSIYAELRLKSQQFFTSLKQAQGKTEQFQKNLGKFEKSAKKLGGTLTKNVSAPIAGIGAAAVLLGKDYQSGMSEVQAISGATGSDLEALENKAREMGATTKFSASEASDGLKYMAMAGWDTNQMIEGLDGVLDLAAASGEDLGVTADIVTDSLTGFGLEAKDSAAFADLLASASSNSNTNVAMMGETFKYVAPLFGSLGYSAEDAALATGLMANAGIKGSQAGTTLRSAVTKLINPTDEAAGLMDDLGLSLTDANGEMKPFEEVMGDLREKFGDLTEEQKAQHAATLFGQESMSGMLAIINASEKDFGKLTESTRDYNGAAKEMAEIMQDNLQGRLEKLKSAAEEAALSIFEAMLPAMEGVVKWAQKMVDKFNSLDKDTQRLIVTIGGIAAAAGPVLVVLGTLAGSVSKIVGLFSLMSGGGAAAAGGLGATGLAAKAAAIAFNPWVLGAAAVVAGGIAIAKKLKEDAIPEVDRFGDKVSENTQQAVGGFMDLTEEANKHLKELAWGHQKITAEMAEDMKEKQSQITETLITAIDERHQEERKQTEEHFASLETLDEETKNRILKKQDAHYENQKDHTQKSHDQINEIIETAEAEGRKITRQEAEKIEKIREGMTKTAVRTMSESEVEQDIIYKRMKKNHSAISAQEAAEVVKNSKKKKDDVIKEANEQHDETEKWAYRQWKEVGSMSEEEYKEVVANSEKQRDEAITNAETKHKGVVNEAQKQAKEHVDEVDWEKGEVLSKGEAMKKGIIKKAKETKENAGKWWKELREDTAQKWEDTKRDASTKWSDITSGIVQKAKDAKEGASGWFGKLKTNAGQMWRDLRTDAIRLGGNFRSAFVGIFNKIARGVGKPVNAVIRGANWILSKFGSSKKIASWPVPQYAKGTEGHLGGPALINDAKGGVYREAVELPDGQRFIPEGRNILFPNMPKGTKVLDAEKTQKLYRYKTGIGDWASGIWNAGKRTVKKIGSKFLDVWDYVKSPGKMVNKVLNKVMDYGGLGGVGLEMAKSLVSKTKSSVVSWAKKKFSEFTNPADLVGTGGPGSNVMGGVGFRGFRKTSPFGWRRHPIFGTGRLHTGVDMAAPTGTNVYAQHPGRVVHGAYTGGYGNMVKIRQGITDYLYAHLSRIIARVGTNVKRGQLIGKVGSTGNSTGPHLHYEKRIHGRPVHPGYARGTNKARAGLAMVGEQGRELINFRGGEKVYSNRETEQLLNIDEEKLATAIVQGMVDKGITKPANIHLNGRRVGEGIVDFLDAELRNKSQEDDIGRGRSKW